MSISYTWNIQRLECYKTLDEYQNVVFNVQGCLVGNDGQDTGIADFAQQLTFTPGPSFTPFEDLSDSQVTAWVESAITPDQLTKLKDQIDADLQRKKTNKEILTPPWVGPAT